MSDDCQRAAGTCFNMVRTDLVFFAIIAPVVPFRQQMALRSVFRTKVINFCLFTFNDDIIRRQIRFLMYEIFIFFIIMLYYIFFLWNSCSTLFKYVGREMIPIIYNIFFTRSGSLADLAFRFHTYVRANN